MSKATDSLEALDAGWKCLGVHYLSFTPAQPHEGTGAAALMRVI